MSSIHMRVGSDWARKLKRALEARPQTGGFDLSVVTDVVDVVVHSRNITAHLAEEGIFPFLCDLADACLWLSSGQAYKALVPSHESPWEFALCAQGDGIWLISLYEVAGDYDVVCLDQRIEAREFAAQLRGCVHQALGHLKAAVPSWKELPLATRLERCREQMDALKWARCQGRAFTQARRRHKIFCGPLALEISYDAGCPGMQLYQDAMPMDMHALCAPGGFGLTLGASVIAADESHGLLSFAQWLRAVERLHQDPRSSRSASRLGISLQRLDNKEWRLSHGRQAAGQGWLLKSEDVLELTRTMLTALFKDFDGLQPSLSQNTRLALWRGAQTALRPVEDAPTRLAAAGADVRLPPPARPVTSGHAWRWGDVRAVHPQISWLKPLGQVDAREMCLVGQVICIREGEDLKALDVSTGQQIWSRPGPLRAGGWAKVGPDQLLVQHTARQCHVLDARQGRLSCTFELPWAMYECRQAIYDPRTQGVLLCGERGDLICLDVPGQRVRWSFKGQAKGAFHFDWDERTLVHLQDSRVTWCSFEQGPLGKPARAGSYARDIWLHGGRAVVVHSGAAQAQTHLCAISVGQPLPDCQLSIEGRYLGAARSLGTDFSVALERGRRPVVELLRGARLQPHWVHPLTSQPRQLAPYFSQLMEVEGVDCVYVCTTAQQTLIEVDTGHTVWSVDASGTTRIVEPLIFDGGVLSWADGLELRTLSEGRLVHKFDRFVDEPQALWRCGNTLELLVAEGTGGDAHRGAGGLVLRVCPSAGASLSARG